jgi:hypothetical protein
MPEAAVYENGDLRPREHDVGRAANSRERPEVDSIAQASGMQTPAKKQLRASIPSRLPAHPIAAGTHET